MSRTKIVDDGVKYTLVLPSKDIEELKRMTDSKIIASVNSGVRMAVEEFISKLRKEAYKARMLQAAADPEFIKRTIDTQNAYSLADFEVEDVSEW